MLYKGNDPVRTLLPEELKSLSRAKEIDFPHITREEIKDRSRGDTLSKGLVILQTGWFVLHCIARHIEHLPITELELVTLAFAALNFATYALWWNKPLNVQCAFRVPLKAGGKVEGIEKVQGAGIAEAESGSEVDDPEIEIEEGWAVFKLGVQDVIKAVRKAPAAIKYVTLGAIAIIHRTPAAISRVINVLGSVVRGVIRDAVHYVRDNGVWGTIVNGIVFTFVLGLLIPILYPILWFVRLAGGEDEKKKEAKSVPTFHSGKLKSHEISLAVLTAMIIATIFGAIHCVAWSFAFPSHAEQMLWRIASLIITCVPALPFVVVAVIAPITLLHLPELPSWLKSAGKSLILLFFVVSSILYIIARVLLLVLPFMCLRSLPPDAYRTVHWVTFIPHI